MHPVDALTVYCYRSEWASSNLLLAVSRYLLRRARWKGSERGLGLCGAELCLAGGDGIDKGFAVWGSADVRLK